MELQRKNTEKSHLKIYWIIWLVSVILLFLIRFLLTNITEQQLGGLFFGYIILVCIPIGMVYSFKQIDIFNYIQAHHKKKWEKHFGTKLNIYSSSLSKLKRICFSKEDFGDPILHLMRKDFRSFFVFTFSVFICTILVDMIMLLVFPAQ